jgi:hypothetical protein
MRDFMQYADARSAQAYQTAVATAGGNVPGIIAQQNKLK